ncbi:prealbumin-like fold domain-containing protein [Lysobacter antibioticus]|uniref:prealbumin-like fold domain-containing protein n=1 Tax=Lysobacter antibioticus TaxID=84531 RepID=UPI0016459BB4|nr:GEVED domain-containing protein [Lysobacter antibioticus]
MKIHHQAAALRRRSAPARARLGSGALAFALCLVAALVAPIAPVRAYQAPTLIAAGLNAAGGTYVLPNNYLVGLAVAGGNLAIDTASTTFNGIGGPVATHYSPGIAPATPALKLDANAGGCAIAAARQTCANRGTVTLTFPQPVRNPSLHFSGLGGNVAGGGLRANHAARFTIASAANGATAVTGLTWTRTAGNANFAATATQAYSNVLAGNTSCTVANNPAACGSLRINGTITRLVIGVGLDTQLQSGSVTLDSGHVDALSLAVTVEEDFGDAPASYDAGQAAVHVLSDLSIGGNLSADNANLAAATASPLASAAADADSDDFVWPALVRGRSVNLSVPLAGASRAGTACGWVDVDNNGSFAAAEGACAGFAAGATVLPLTIAIPANAVAGQRVARVRVSYGSALSAATPSGRADSGEVEDALVRVAEPARIVLRKTTLGGTGSFGFALGNTVQAGGSATTVAIGTPVQVDGDTATGGVQGFAVQSAGAAVSIDENALPAGWRLSSARCTDAGGATVGSLSGTVYAIPGSATGLDAVLTCDFVNARQPLLRLRKSLPLGRFVAGDQFVLSIAGNGAPVSATTSGAGDAPPEIATIDPAEIGTVYTFGETGAGATDLSGYTTTYACSNALPGGQAPSGNGRSFALTPVAGDDLTCTFRNTRQPLADLTIHKTNTPAAGADDPSGDTLARGASTTYTIVVGNNGPDAVTGAILRDPIASRSGIRCTAPPSCSGTACPAGLSLAQLDAGVALGTLVNGGSVTVTLTCTVD